MTEAQLAASRTDGKVSLSSLDPGAPTSPGPGPRAPGPEKKREIQRAASERSNGLEEHVVRVCCFSSQGAPFG